MGPSWTVHPQSAGAADCVADLLAAVPVPCWVEDWSDMPPDLSADPAVAAGAVRCVAANPAALDLHGPAAAERRPSLEASLPGWRAALAAGADLPALDLANAAGGLALRLTARRLSGPDLRIVVCELPRMAPASAGTADSHERAERLEAIGRLTGGIAHDFNNLLAVVMGNAELLADLLPQGGTEARMAESILRAAERAAELTGQLLAFARRQPLMPRSVDLNATLGRIQTLVARSLTPQIRMQLDLAPDLWLVDVDPSAFETAVLHLCANARDAMPSGGTLTIGTANAVLEPSDGSEDGEPGPGGAFVRLTVTDTGTGMDAETRKRVFEPFFTTKPKAVGRGMGLPMVHGFVRQSGGQMRIATAAGYGTAVSMFLPRAQPKPDP